MTLPLIPGANPKPPHYQIAVSIPALYQDVYDEYGLIVHVNYPASQTVVDCTPDCTAGTLTINSVSDANVLGTLPPSPYYITRNIPLPTVAAPNQTEIARMEYKIDWTAGVEHQWGIRYFPCSIPQQGKGIPQYRFQSRNYVRLTVTRTAFRTTWPTNTVGWPPAVRDKDPLDQQSALYVGAFTPDAELFKSAGWCKGCVPCPVGTVMGMWRDVQWPPPPPPAQGGAQPPIPPKSTL